MTDTTTDLWPPRAYPHRTWVEDPSDPWHVPTELRADYVRLYPAEPGKWQSPQAIAPDLAATLPPDLFNLSTDVRDLPELVVVDPERMPVSVSFGPDGALYLDHRRTLSAARRLHDPLRQAEGQAAAAAFMRRTPPCAVCGALRGQGAPTINAYGHTHPVCDECHAAAGLALAEQASTLDAARAWVTGLRA